MNVQLLDIAKEIRTFTERMEDNEALAVIRRRIEEAETIVFLGFAFHPLNMKLLAPGVRSHAKRVFATAKGISNTDMVVVERSVIDTLQVDAQHANGTLTVMTRNDLTCVGLFEEYWRASPKGFDFLSRSSGAIKHLVPGSKGDSRPTAEIEHLRLAVVGIDDG